MKIIQKIPKVCFTCINKLSIHAYFALISKCELFYIKPFAYRRFMFCNIVGKHQIDVFLRFLNYAAYLTDNETSLPLNAHWTQTSNPYKALHVFFRRFSFLQCFQYLICLQKSVQTQVCQFCADQPIQLRGFEQKYHINMRNSFALNTPFTFRNL